MNLMRESLQINRLMRELKHTYTLGTRQRRMLRTLDNRYGLDGRFVMAEVGVAEGFTSEILLRFFPNMFLHLIDSWFDADPEHQLVHDRNKKEAIARVSPYRQGMRYWIHAETSRDASHCFHRECLDVVFLDAAHTYECVMEDLNLWWPKVNHGGIFCGDDYNGLKDKRKIWGVKLAVDEFFTSRNLQVRIGAKNFFWVDKP